MKNTLLTIHLPYCLQRLSDGRYILLNRLYKPLGISSKDWVDYETHPSAFRPKGINSAVAQKLSWEESPALDALWLYKDGSKPTLSAEHWAAYSARLQVLASLQQES